MTNLEYIREKRKEKFSILWDLIVPNLPVVSAVNSISRTIEFREKWYFFNKKTKGGEICLVCRTGVFDGSDEKGINKQEYDKKELQELFCNYTEFKNDTIRAICRLKERWRDLSDFEYDIRKEIETSIWHHQIQIEYAAAFFAFLGWSIKRENEYTHYTSVSEIKSWVETCKAEKNLPRRYYEFLPYKLSKIRKFYNVNINNILLDKRDEDFIEFCLTNGFNKLFLLLLMPYYSKGILGRFGVETVERIIREIKAFLDVHILYEEYVTSDDIVGE